MEKGDKPKKMTSAKAEKKPAKQKKPAKEKKPAKQKQKQKQKQENVQIVKVNVNTSKEEKPVKPVRKEITRQTTYLTLDKPYVLQPEEEELLTITKHVPNPPRDKSRAKVNTLVSDPKNEIPQANIQEQPIALMEQVPIKKKVSAKKKGLFDVPVEIFVGAKPVVKKGIDILKQVKEIKDILLPEPEILKVKPQKKPRKLKEPKYDVPIEIFEPKKRKLAKTIEEEQSLVEITETKGKKVKEIIKSPNSSSIDKSIQNSSINNNEKVQELVLAEPTVSEKKTGLIISSKKIDDYISNTDDANISNPNSSEIINIQNENELEEEFSLTSAQLESYKEDYVMTAKGTVEGLSETIEKKSPRGRPSKYASEEERQLAIKEQKKASSRRIIEEKKIEEQKREEKEKFTKSLKQLETVIQGDYPPISLEEMILKDVVIPEKEFSEGFFASLSAEDLGQNLGQDIIVSSTTKSGLKKEKPEISSDFASALVDKLSDNNNFGSVQSAQESQFEFE
jgi:hypothetical protein